MIDVVDVFRDDPVSCVNVGGGEILKDCSVCKVSKLHLYGVAVGSDGFERCEALDLTVAVVDSSPDFAMVLRLFTVPAHQQPS